MTRSSAAHPPANVSGDSHAHAHAYAHTRNSNTYTSQTLQSNPPPKRRATSQAGGVRRRGAKRPRSRHQSGFYEEDDDSDEDDWDDDGDETPPSPAVEHRRSPRRTRNTRPRSRVVVKTAKNAAPAPSRVAPRKAKTTPRKSAPRKATPRKLGTSGLNEGITKPADPTDSGVIPDWLSLPYLILVQVFMYASAPLDDREDANWLLATSRVCRAFAEPALTALYQCPPLLTRHMAHGLVALLSTDPSKTMFNYRSKVEKLRIDVEEIAAKTYRGQLLDFRALIAHLPRLQVVTFSHRKDLPPFRSLDDPLRWQYPDALFEALNGVSPTGDEGGAQLTPTKLTGWRWNRRLMGLDTSPARIKSLHMTPAFAGLKKLSFVNYQVPSLHRAAREVSPTTNAMDQASVQNLADAISVLPELEYLSVESSTVVNDEFLSLLPKSLRTLELINCWEVGGEDFANYLVSHGYKLEHLNLRHNQSLSLSFLTVLGSACPALQTLCVDLKNYNHHEFYNDSDPNYAEVLAVDQTPTWPESLERIELRNMRKWSAEAAEVLFQSLVDSAPNLPNLRHLDLKTMLDVPFRQRSALRDKWEAKLKRVFLRKLEDPKPIFSLRSKSAAPAGTKATTKGRKEDKSREAVASDGEARRSHRIATQVSNPSSSRDSSMGRDLRDVRTRPSYAEVDTDADEVEDGGEESDRAEDSEESGTEDGKKSGEGEEEDFRHGMCETVDIQLDNQKPAETTWQMDDFLDEEADDASDEDWDGDVEGGGDGYAW
jgi:hypothetical protein